ncbi:hypothetical protein HID58_031193 [Brassica napus]|uniref:Uncharacterized protein n=1 Tax=Brassica napus TaxID=3708 RepID=A0ABQ8CJ02_BRANA|nr:hypothetical protein HID58_031193 [Brassica napus]
MVKRSVWREKREKRERIVSLRRTAGACASVPSPENFFRLVFDPFPRCLRRSTIVRLVGALLPSLIVNGGAALESRRVRTVERGGDGAFDARTGEVSLTLFAGYWITVRGGSHSSLIPGWDPLFWVW